MALETVTHISDLVVTNPTSTDPKSEGDNHLRNIKTALKTDFPNISGVVTKTHTQLNNALDKTGDTMTGNLNVPSLNGGHLGGLRNKLINANFNIWQRGTSFVSASGLIYTADRWAFYRNSLVAGATVSRQTGARWKYCVRVQRDSGNTAVDPIFLGQIIESLNCYALAGQTVTLRARMRAGANFSGTSVSVRLFSGTAEDQGNISAAGGWTGVSNVIDTTQAITTSFTDYTFTASVPSNARELAVRFAFTPTGTAGVADYIEIEEVQLEIGSAATPLEDRLYGLELALCQRYYYRLFPAAISRTLGPIAYATTTTNARASLPFPVPMRVAPSALEQSGTANHYAVDIAGTVTVCSAAPAYATSTSDTTAVVNFTVASGLTAGQAGRALSDATNGASAYLGWSAEL